MFEYHKTCAACGSRFEPWFLAVGEIPNRKAIEMEVCEGCAGDDTNDDNPRVERIVRRLAPGGSHG